MTNWEKWLKELSETKDKASFLCGIHDAGCYCRLTGKYCPLYTYRDCRKTGNQYLDREEQK